GPGYGIETLSDARRLSDGILDRPFPYQARRSDYYKDSEAAYHETPPDEFADVMEHEPAEDGALRIAGFGCGIGILLVITGPERGNLWHNDRDSGVMSPWGSDEPNERIGFLQWYEDWLETSISQLSS